MPDTQSELLRDWQEWEARWIMDERAWRGDDPIIPCVLHDEYVANLTARRDAFLASQKEAKPADALEAVEGFVCVGCGNGPDYVEALEREVARLRESNLALTTQLAFYADQLCEGWCQGKDPKACAAIGEDNCAGCPAVVTISRARQALGDHDGQ